MGMDRLIEYLDHLSANPPAHIILKAVNTPEGASGRPPVSAEDEIADLGAIASEVGAIGSTPSVVPPWLRQLADEATAIKQTIK